MFNYNVFLFWGVANLSELINVHPQAVKVVIHQCSYTFSHTVKTNQVRNESIALLVPACVISVINRDDSSAEGLQYNRYKNNSLSPQRTEDWFQYKRYFNICDFNLTEFYLQRKWETEVGDLLLFQYKRYFKLSDFNISGVSCIS